jgi:hypothetical protein
LVRSEQERVGREIRTLRAMWRRLETERRDGLRHRHEAKATGNSYSPNLRPPRQSSTLLAGGPAETWTMVELGPHLAYRKSECWKLSA